MEQANQAQGFLAIKAAIRKERRKRRRRQAMVVALLGTTLLTMAYVIVSMFSPAGPYTHGPIQFEAAPLGEVEIALERRYGVEIEGIEGLRNCKFTGSFYGGSAEQVIGAIAESLGANVITTAKGAFRIKGGECR